MKVRLTMKDPDALYDAVAEAVAADVKKLEGLTDQERDDLAETRREKVRGRIVENWMEWGEYLEVEFDLDAMSATVIGRKTNGA